MALNYEMLSITSFQHYLLGLFAVANNFPALGPFLNLTKGLPNRHVKRVITLASLSSLLIMLGACFLGTAVLQFFGIGVSAFQIAGGLLLGASGLKMLNAKDPGDSHEKNYDASHMDISKMTSSAIVPISLPLTTGAGTMSTVTLYASSTTSSNQRIELFAAILAMALIIALLFAFAARLTLVLGQVGMTVLIKVMGLFTLAIGIQFIVTAIKTILEQVQFKI